MGLRVLILTGLAGFLAGGRAFAVSAAATAGSAQTAPPSPAAPGGDNDRFVGGAQDLLNNTRITKSPNQTVPDSGLDTYQQAKDALYKIRNPQVAVPASQ